MEKTILIYAGVCLLQNGSKGYKYFDEKNLSTPLVFKTKFECSKNIGNMLECEVEGGTSFKKAVGIPRFASDEFISKNSAISLANLERIEQDKIANACETF